MKTIGFIGVGIMGKSMVRNLMKAGFEVRIMPEIKRRSKMLLQRAPGSLKPSENA